MGIVKNNKNIIAIYRGDKKITSVFKNNLKIFGESEPPQYNYKNVTLRTSSNNEKVKLYNNYYFDSIYIYDDNVTINPTETNEYTFTTRGDHKVGYAIKKGITSFYAAFKNIYQLVGIDDDFFSDNIELNDISEAFQNVRIENLKKELVSPLINLEKVSNTFSNNSYLSTVAFDLFADNEKIKDFSSTFNNCYNWYGNCPVDKNGKKLFVRSEGNNGYVVPDYTENCFLGCSGLDMEIIPSTWGGNKKDGLQLTISFSTDYGSYNHLLTNHIEYFSEIRGKNYDIVVYTDDGRSGGFEYNILGSGIGDGILTFTFKNNIQVIDYAFSSCSTMLRVSGRLPSTVTSVKGLFYTTPIYEINTDFFASSKDINDFSYTFYNCTSLSSYVPTDDGGRPIYNRSDGQPGYTIPSITSGCFYNCVNMQGYSEIPSTWT